MAVLLVAVLIITTIHSGGTRITGNLLAPLVINVDTRLGVQIVQENPDWGVQKEMNYLKFGLAVDGEALENNPVIDGGRDSSSESDQSEVRPEVETPEPAGV